MPHWPPIINAVQLPVTCYRMTVTNLMPPRPPIIKAVRLPDASSNRMTVNNCTPQRSPIINEIRLSVASELFYVTERLLV